MYDCKTWGWVERGSLILFVMHSTLKVLFGGEWQVVWLGHSF